MESWKKEDESIYTTDEIIRMGFDINEDGFDHKFLRSLGLPCGQDEAQEHYCLCWEGEDTWKIWKVSVLADMVAAFLKKM